MADSQPQSDFLLVQERDSVLREFRSPVESHLEGVQHEVAAFFDGQSTLVHSLADHVLSIQGKRVRPTLLLLVAGMGNRLGPTAVRAAAMLELVHTATLIHDDSIDRSLVRRGQPTINALWNDRVAVIFGDYLYTKAFETLVRERLWKPVAVLSRTAHRMSFGEMLAMEQKSNLDLSEEDYFRFISEKTASLISAACEIGAAVGYDDERVHDEFRDFGHEIGMAYQITDDLFDYYGDAGALGKDIGSDLREGKVTLPVIRALRTAPRKDYDLVAKIVAERAMSRSEWEDVSRMLRESDAFGYSEKLALDFASRARARLEGFPDSIYKDALALAVSFVVQRCH
jgi:octaprenyl-diphosphate synthase